jgi:hypothetical protein
LDCSVPASLHKPRQAIRHPKHRAVHHRRFRSRRLSSRPNSMRSSRRLRCTDLDDVVRNLATGTYFFNHPKLVKVGEEFLLRLILQTQEDQASDFDGAPGPIESKEKRPFAQSLEATLSGQDFEISPSGPQARTATTAQPVEWNWKLTPASTGKKHSRLRLLQIF